MKATCKTGEQAQPVVGAEHIERTKPVNVLLRLDPKLHSEFKEACASRHDSQQTALLKFIEAYVESHNEAGIRHMNGDVCPLSGLIMNLGDAVRAQLGGHPRGD
jgi:hypothetical protein